jgi:hypothetical protein
MSDSDHERIETLVKGALAVAKNEEAAKNTLALLFPRIDKAIDTYVPSDADIATRKRKRRLSLSDFSQSYFALSPQPDSWGQLEFDSAIKTTPDAAFDALRQKLKSATSRDQPVLRRLFIELLDTEFSIGKILDESWLKAIIKESPELISESDEETKFLFTVDNEDRLRWLIVNGLAKLSPEEAATLLKSAIRSADDLTVLVEVVRGLVGDSHPEGAQSAHDHRRVHLGDEAENVREMLVDRIRGLALTEEIWNQAKPANLLWFWWGTNKEAEVKAFTSKAMSTPLGLTGLLRASISRVISSAGNYERVSPTWAKLADLAEVRRHAEALIRSSDEANTPLAERFLAALKRGQESSF